MEISTLGLLIFSRTPVVHCFALLYCYRLTLTDNNVITIYGFANSMI